MERWSELPRKKTEPGFEFSCLAWESTLLEVPAGSINRSMEKYLRNPRILTTDMQKTKQCEVQGRDLLGWGSYCFSSAVGKEVTSELRPKGWEGVGWSKIGWKVVPGEIGLAVDTAVPGPTAGNKLGRVLWRRESNPKLLKRNASERGGRRGHDHDWQRLGHLVSYRVLRVWPQEACAEKGTHGTVLIIPTSLQYKTVLEL